MALKVLGLGTQYHQYLLPSLSPIPLIPAYQRYHPPTFTTCPPLPAYHLPTVAFLFPSHLNDNLPGKRVKGTEQERELVTWDTGSTGRTGTAGKGGKAGTTGKGDKEGNWYEW